MNTSEPGDGILHEESIDYKALLISYMMKVIDCEGVSFVDAHSHTHSLTSEEELLLTGIEEEIFESEIEKKQQESGA